MKITPKTRSLFIFTLMVAVGAAAYTQGMLDPYLKQGRGLWEPYLKKISFGGKPGGTLAEKDFEFKPVERRGMLQTVTATGTVTLQVGAEVKIGSRTSGQLDKLNVQIGDPVHAGDVIAVIAHDELQARLMQRKAELDGEMAKLEKIRVEGPLEIRKRVAELEELQAQLKLSGKTVQRNKELHRDGIVAVSVLEKAEEDFLVLQAKIKSTTENLRLREAQLNQDIRLEETLVQKAKANLAEAKTLLSYATIVATIDGVVASIATQKGETVAAGLNSPIFVTLVDLRRLEATVYVDETDIGRIRPGQEARFTVDSYPNKFFKGEVREIRPKAVIKDNVVNYETILNIDKSGIELLRPEMTANVLITIDSKDDVLAAPKQAIKRKGKAEFVVVKEGGRIEDRPVTTGWRDRDGMEILTGLKEGDLVGVPLKPGEQDKGEQKGRKRS